MNNEYLARAKEIIPDAKGLILLASKRASELSRGAHPMVRCKEENYLDVALLEIAEGKLQLKFEESGAADDLIKELEAAKNAATAAPKVD